MVHYMSYTVFKVCALHVLHSFQGLYITSLQCLQGLYITCLQCFQGLYITCLQWLQRLTDHEDIDHAMLH